MTLSGKELLAVFQYVFNNYDRSRTRLNFQVSKGGELGPVDKTKSITDKIEQAIKNRVTGRMNATSNRAVSIVFFLGGGNREQMRELHSRLAEVNERYGLERGDDLTITGAKHKSTETYRRELADECRTLSNEVGMKQTLLSGLNRSITKAETKIKALQTMVSNLEKAEAEKQATIAEREGYMKNHLGDAVEIKAKITATRKELWDVRDKLNDKKIKLEQAKLQLDKLQKNTFHIEARNREIKADFEKTAVSYQQQMINKIWAQAGMKALAEIADIYPRMTSIHDSSLFDDSFAMDFINHGDKIIYCAMYLYIGYVNEATNFAESQGGGGSDTKDWRREKDEDEIEWIR